jgi:hypothetical protein
MAISTDTVVEFFGTQDLVTESSTPSVGSSLFSATAAIVDWANDDDAPEAVAYWRCTFDTAPAPGGSVPLYLRHMAVGPNSTDMDAPSTINKRHLAAVFPVTTSTEVQIHTDRFYLPNMEASQTYQFFVENQASQTLSSNWVLYVTPLTQGPSTG